MTHAPRDVKRMAGQLLLHHPAIGRLAYDKNQNGVDPTHPSACQWCYHGALRACAVALGVAHNDVLRETPNCVSAPAWDRAYPQQRRAWAQELANS